MAKTTRTDPPRRRIGYEARREAVLAAGLNAFAEVGFAAATMDDIARRAGITKAVVYDHFPSKRALYLAVLERERDAVLDHVRRRLDGGGTRAVAGALDAFFAWVETHPHAWMLLFRDAAADRETAAAQRAVQAQAHLTVVDALLPPGVPDDAKRAMAAAVGGATHGVARWWRDNPAMPREQVVATVMDVLWRGLERTARRRDG